MSAHAYSEDQLVEPLDSGMGATNRIIPTSDWRWVLFKSLADVCRKPMFCNEFLFEWKTSA